MVIFHSFLYVYQRVILILGNHYIVIPNLDGSLQEQRSRLLWTTKRLTITAVSRGIGNHHCVFKFFFFSSDRCFPTVFFVRDEVGFKCSMFSPEVPLR